VRQTVETPLLLTVSHGIHEEAEDVEEDTSKNQPCHIGVVEAVRQLVCDGA